ncbi:hypothetical protein BOTBODRAFT_28829 [Botryobasidium botryosum FD-172 SS1]|uniref:Aminopeptidase n=1 Tax=Botryobasidium botryosum (strain FD-172 SS1) TaxID=930990 RepID=A0A067MUS0_BOTB1|nr:hypothetical protein BOTBODRAFT_28829 [Botryobasidium botryosum FD-172 SS1]
MSAPTTLQKPKDVYRLPEDVKPTHYDLTFKTDLEKPAFSGYAVIDLDVLEETSVITFNSAAIKLQKCSIKSDALKEEQTEISQVADEAQERVAVRFEKPLPKGSKAQLCIGWEAPLTDNMMGYYLSSAPHEGKKRNYALTHFEPTAARRAFPCWDEPLLKATYTITLISREDTVNLSNMPAIEEHSLAQKDSPEDETSLGRLSRILASFVANEPPATANSGWKVTKFQKTPPVSTYLVAFANGHFSHLESSYTSPISGKTRPLRIYATPDIIHQAQYALDLKAKVLPIYEEVFEVEYPLPKLDTLVAHDFDAGAMENWGLITGRTSAFLFDEKKSSLEAKKRVAGTQSHEVAHMWFGDIVTMSWWDNLWLNEGFATLMGEVIIMDRVYPEWKVNSSFITDHLERALDLDAQRSSHPIEVDCPDANQINQIFDALSYSKAGSMLRMLANYVGEKEFLKGVSIYLRDHLYGNSVTRDLWDGIAKATGQDIPKIMENWVLKIGFPVITVTEKEGGIHIRQDRFLSSGDVKEEENQTIWYIPLSLLTTDANGKSSVDRSIVLDKREMTIPLDTSKPFKLNAGTVSVFRTAYSPERLTKLGEQASAKNSVFSTEDRMGLVTDAFELARSNVSKTSGALNLINKLRSEKEQLVWNSIGTELGRVQSVWWEQPKEVRERLNALRRTLFGPLVENLGYEYSPSDSPDIRELRTLAVSTSAVADHPEVVKELRARFKHLQDTGDDSRIPADLQRIAYRIAVQHGGREEHEAVRKLFKTPSTPSSKIASMMALGFTQDSALIEETLAFTLTNVQTQDLPYFFSGLSANPASRRKLSGFFQDNFDEFYKRFDGNFSLGNLIKASFQQFTSEKDAAQVEAFFKTKDVSKFNLALAQSLDKVRVNAAWVERDGKDVTDWLAAWNKENNA